MHTTYNKYILSFNQNLNKCATEIDKVRFNKSNYWNFEDFTQNLAKSAMRAI